MYYAMRASAPSLHRESTDSLILYYHMYNVMSFVYLPRVMMGFDHTYAVGVCISIYATADEEPNFAKTTPEHAYISFIYPG